MCVQEEERLKHEKVESTHLATHVKENARKGKNALQVKKKHIKHNDNKNKTEEKKYIKHNDNKNKTKCIFFFFARKKGI